MTSKVCARCKTVRPAEAFRPNPKLKSGLNSWCRTCQVQATAEWRQRNPAYTDADRHKKHTYYADPLAYSANVCAHIAAHTLRAIQRFEAATHKEAPPHLTEIYRLATTLSTIEHSAVKPQRVKACVICGTTFETHTNLRSYCSQPCSTKANYEHQKQLDPEKVKEKNRAKLAKRTPEQRARYAAQSRAHAAQKRADRIARRTSSDPSATTQTGGRPHPPPEPRIREPLR